MKEFKNDLENETHYSCIFRIFYDIKYMARPECIKYCINRTDWIEQIIGIGSLFYFVDAKPQRQTMIDNMHDGQYCSSAVELEL